jgi:hypothetical protein
MTRAKVLIGCMASMLSVMLITSPIALAAPPEPGLLQTSDVPGTFEAGERVTNAVVNQFVIDGDACTQGIEADSAAIEYTGVAFNVPTSDLSAFSEAVITYPDAKTAKTAFKHRAATVRAGVKCGSVDYVIPNSPPSSLTYDKMKFPKLGLSAYATERSLGDAATNVVAVEFLSGPYIVLIDSSVNSGGPSVKALKTICRKAEKRLRESG